MLRKILHVDMDAFFASVEQRDRPELCGRPVLVGGDPAGRGVVSAASYEARRFGCHSAMPTSQALRLCPQAVVVRPRMNRYLEVSECVFEVLARFTPLVEPLSVDEAFLDVTGCTLLWGLPERMAQQIKTDIREQTRLTASVGVAPNKFLAKLASDLQKPDGLVVVPADGIRAFLDPLPISRLWGVGRATLPRFERLGVYTFADLRRLPLSTLERDFGELGGAFHRLGHGLDDRPVIPDREAQSVSHEVTFPVDVADPGYLRAVLLEQIDHVARRLRRHELRARTIRIKIRSAEFLTTTRSRTLSDATDETDAFWQVAVTLFENWRRRAWCSVRLIGVGVSQLSRRRDRQLLLFDDAAARRRELDQTLDRIRQRFGDAAVARGSSIQLDK